MTPREMGRAVAYESAGIDPRGEWPDEDAACGDGSPLAPWGPRKLKAMRRAYRAKRHALGLPRHDGPRSARRAKPL